MKQARLAHPWLYSGDEGAMQTGFISAQLDKPQSDTYCWVQSLIRLEVLPFNFDQGLKVEYCCRALGSVVAEFRQLFQDL
jgi:hypothetical protein